MPAPPHFEPPVVVAIFPLYAVLSWEPPHDTVNRAFAEHTSWDYCVEYSCSCRVRHHPYTTSTANTYALLATPHTGETYYVRVVARATFAGSMAGLVSSKTSFVAKSTVAVPWSTSAPSPCIFDGLYVCAANAWSSAAALAAVGESRSTLPLEHPCVLERSVYVCVLDADVEFRLYKASYDCAVSPANKRTVFYLATTGRRTRSVQRLHSKEIEVLLLRDDAALVFCGVGDGGRIAVKAAHALVSSFTHSSPALCTLVFCIAYGTPRSSLTESPQLLLHTLPQSWHFLHVTRLPLRNGAAALDGDLEVSRRCLDADTALSPLRHKSYAEGFYKNTLLGVQCSVADLSNNSTAKAAPELQFSAADPALPLTAGEDNEAFDVEACLQCLSQVFFPATPSWLAPVVKSLHCRTTGPLLYVTVEGTNLQFCPRLTLLPPQHVPAFPCISTCEPQRLICVCSLLPWIEGCTSVREEGAAGVKDALEMPLYMLVQTSFGTCVASPEEVVELPRNLVELFRWPTAEMPGPWASATPSALLECALQTLPLYVLCRSPSQHTYVPDVALNPVEEILSTFASAAEAALVEKTQTTSTGGNTTSSVFGFVSDMVSRFSSAVTSASSDSAPKLSVPTREATFLKNALKEWAASTSASIDDWRLRSASWKQRIHHALPSLGDTLYRGTLIRMLRLFDRHADDSTDESTPHLWLEARLDMHVRFHMCARLGTNAANMDCLLCTSITLSDFYAAVVDVFTSAAAASNTTSTTGPLPHVEEVMLLWCLCHCFELRRELSSTFFCCVVGCAGCGGTTVCNTLASLLQSEEAFRYPHSTMLRRQLTCRLAASRFSALFLAMQSGVRLSVFLAVEVADLMRPQYVGVSVLLQESLAFAHQHLFRVITKVDEHLCYMHAPTGTPVLDISASAFLELATEEVLGSSATDEHRLLVSLAPSPFLIEQVFKCSQEKAVVFASELRAASQRALLRCLVSSIGHANAAALS